MTTPYEAYNRGAIGLAEHFDIGRVSASDFVLDHNPYPADETWILFEPSDDIDYGPLDGRKAKLVHESGVKVTFAMHRSSDTQPSYMSSAWARPAYIGPVFRFGWYGRHGWKLYIQGELPTKQDPAYKEES